MMHTRLSICRWRTFIENIFGCAFALLDRFLEDLGLLPKLQDVLFHRGNVEFRRYRFEHSCLRLFRRCQGSALLPKAISSDGLRDCFVATLLAMTESS